MCVEDASEYIWLRLEARRVLIGNRKVSNWIVFREKSDNFLKCLLLVVISEDFDG